MSFWEKGKKPSAMHLDKPSAIPVFSVDTVEDAEQILTHFGKLSYDGGDYYWHPFSGDYNELFEITDTLRDYYPKNKEKGTLSGRKDWSPKPKTALTDSPQDVAQFMDGYIETALWSTNDETGKGEFLDENYKSTDIAPKTMETMIEDGLAFLEANLDDIGHRLSRAGHDFWLTRNGHGAGFWDGDWPEPAATRLTQNAHAYGGFDLYIGDDKKIHGQSG